MKNKSNVKRGFTLVELLVVVLIVGILVSVALPLYQNAVDKSRWATLLSPSRAIANAEEAVLMSNGAYTVNKEDLVVSLPNDGEYDYQLYTTANGDDGDLVRVSSDKLEDVRLARHYEKDARFPNQLYCEAKVGNARAKKLCEKLLQGSEVFTTDDGYKMYFLSGQMSEAVCEGANGFWSSGKNTCYQTQTEKCDAVGGNALSNGQCGWHNQIRSREVHATADTVCLADGDHYDNCWGTFESGSKCIVEGPGSVRSNSCAYSTFKSGSECVAHVEGTPDGGGQCVRSTFETGSKCIGDSVRACTASTFETGSQCVAKVEGACQGNDYSQGGCCVADGGTCPAGTEC